VVRHTILGDKKSFDHIKTRVTEKRRAEFLSKMSRKMSINYFAQIKAAG
jgi:hypothetical protein